MGRAFVVLLTLFAYVVALRAPESIFELAIQYAFSGFAALSPLLVAALFWRGSTKWGALASTLWVAVAVAAVAVFQAVVPAPAPGPAHGRVVPGGPGCPGPHRRGHGGPRLHAGGADGAGVGAADGAGVALHPEAEPDHPCPVLLLD